MLFRLNLAYGLGRTLGELEASLDHGEYLLWVARGNLLAKERKRQEQEHARGGR